MKIAHSKPFNVEHAKDGAPYCCAAGPAAEVFKWDAKNKIYPLLGALITSSGSEIAASWTAKGSWAADGDCPQDLVMLPLGMIAGLPVFTGDMLFYARKSTEFAAMAQHRQSDFDAGMGCTWPVPAKVYPMSLMEISDAIDAKIGQLPAGWTLIANAAIRHAIDAGQVVIPSELTPGVRKHNPYTGHLRDQRDIASDPMGILIHCEGETVFAADRDARDMKIARAFVNALGHGATRDFILEVIATVPK